jgi:hypothetical protein
MNDKLSLHSLSLEQIDIIIKQTRPTLSEEEKKNFTNDLQHIDIEYTKDVQILINNKFKD